MFGKNPILKAENHAGDSLKITEIFDTFQGEGIYAGWPAIFVRLGGCNLACDFCDTEFDQFEEIALPKILQKIQEKAKNNRAQLVVITGGEPLRQPIEKFCQELISLGFLVQIETNGTIFRDLPREVKIICSPKISNGKYHPLRLDLLERVDALKFIISAQKNGYADIADYAKNDFDAPVFLQPMDEYDEEKNARNAQLTLDLARRFGCRISLQIHKILGIR